MSEPKRRCDSCIWFVCLDPVNDRRGRCQLLPPLFDGRWPIVEPGDFCSYWRPVMKLELKQPEPGAASSSRSAKFVCSRCGYIGILPEYDETADVPLCPLCRLDGFVSKMESAI